MLPSLLVLETELPACQIAKVAEPQDIREATERELEDLRNCQKHLEKLKKYRDALLQSLTKMVPASLENLSKLERNKVYRMLRLRVTHCEGVAQKISQRRPDRNLCPSAPHG